jgi:heme/copper-type cytochrome/quinol oxidase subunit 2
MQVRTVSRASIVLWVVAAGMLLSVLLVFRNERASQSDQRPVKRGSAWSPTALDDPLTVQATGHEFFWRFRFPGPDARFDTGDDLRIDKEVHLPLGRDIVFLITSDDFVYTMSIPALNLRQIAVPELTYTLSFHTTSAGEFDVIADPLCSVRFFHNESMGRVVVQSESAFASWYRAVQ